VANNQISGGILNPYGMIKDASGWIGDHWLILVVLSVLIGCIAAYLLYAFYAEYMSIPARERSFRRGKSSISQTIRVELLERIKRKKKRPY